MNGNQSRASDVGTASVLPQVANNGISKTGKIASNYQISEN